MTKKTYLISETEINDIDDLLAAGEYDDIMKINNMLQSLPMVDSEPAAFMFHTDEYDEIGGLAPLPSKRDLLEIGKLGATVIPLYTAPKPLQP